MGAQERPKFHFVQHEVTVMPCGWVFRRGLSLRRHNLSYAGFRKVLRKKKLRKIIFSYSVRKIFKKKTNIIQND